MRKKSAMKKNTNWWKGIATVNPFQIFVSLPAFPGAHSTHGLSPIKRTAPMQVML